MVSCIFLLSDGINKGKKNILVNICFIRLRSRSNFLVVKTTFRSLVVNVRKIIFSSSKSFPKKLPSMPTYLGSRSASFCRPTFQLFSRAAEMTQDAHGYTCSHIFEYTLHALI